MKNRLYLRFFTKRNMKRQLLAMFICAIVIPILIVGGIINFYTYRNMVSDYENLTLSQTGLIHSTIVSTSIYLHSVSETVRTNEELQRLLSADHMAADREKASWEQEDFFEDILANTSTIESLRLYVPLRLMQGIKPNRYILPLTEDVKSSRWYQKASDISGGFWISETRTGQNEMEYWELHYCCRIPVPKKQTYAILVMSVSNDYLRSLISNHNYQYYINVNGEPVFISSDRRYAGEGFPVGLDGENAGSRTGIFTLFGEDTVASLKTASLYQSSDQLHILVADTEALPAVWHLLRTFVLVMLFALLISAVIIFLYATYFGARINTLRLAMYKVSNDDYEIVDTIRGDDELTATFHDMKVMVAKLKDAQAQVYQVQIQEQMLANQQQRMELDLLANQINPHFLYNTLESIRMKAFVEGNKDVANAIKLLSKSMRYVLGNTKSTTTTLDKEVDYIVTYLEIQRLRFGARISYEICVEGGLVLEHYQILPLLLQPVVENAISHGLKDMEEGGHIVLKLSSSCDRTLLLAEIFDNGIGMEGKKLSQILSQIDAPVKDSGHGVGLSNIHSRIRLFYGQEYGVKIQSRFHHGTCVTITIPLYNNTEEEL